MITMTVAEFPVVSEQDKVNEEAYWKREQARYDFAEWQASQWEAQEAAEYHEMTPDRREAAVYVLDDRAVEPW